MLKHHLYLCCIYLFLYNFGTHQAHAKTRISLEDISGPAFKEPVLARQHRSDPGTWYVAERSGKIIKWTSSNNQYVFLDLQKNVNSTRNAEAGLLGFDFDPEYPKKNNVYISYTSGHNPFVSRISRVRCCTQSGQLDTTTEEIILSVEQPYGNHNGGHIVFGPDGFLYIGLGDGGASGDPHKNAQNRKSLLGNILRIDTNKEPYAIPPTNPFINTSYRKEIYAWGLRNPWRFHFDLTTGQLWAGDVGQRRWEEIDIIESGKNYGWNIMEGKHCYKSFKCKRNNLTLPLAEYSQNKGDKSITGGYIYRGRKIESLLSAYIFADFVSGRIFKLHPKDKTKIDMIQQTPYHISSFAQDLNNELYILAYYQGKLLKLTPLN